MLSILKKNTFLIIILFSTTLFGYDLRGIVLDMNTNEPLSGANIQIFEEEKYTFSDEDGYFNIRDIHSAELELKVSYIGYKTQRILVDMEKSSSSLQKIYLLPSLIQFEAVRVTITKTEKSLSGSSLPIAFMDDQEISKRIPNEVSTAIASEPGISVSSDGVWGKTISIRGLSKNSIVTMVDGNRISTATNLAAALSLIDINDVDRIETIKSGSSSLYGTGAIGGVINIITKQADFSNKFYIEPTLNIGFNSANKMHYEGVSVMSGAKYWNAKISLQNRKAQDIETPEGTLENSQFEDHNVSAKLNIMPFANHEISLNYQNFQAENVGIPGGNPIFSEDADVRYIEAYRRLYSLTYEIKNLLPILTNLSMKIYQQDIFRDVENIPHVVKTSGNKEIHVLKVLPNALHKTSGFQLQSDWILMENNYLTIGADGWQKDLKSRRKKIMEIFVKNANNETIKTINQTLGELPLPNSKYQTAGIYFNDDHYLMNKKFLVNFGGRIDMTKIESDEVWNPDYQIVNGVRNDDPATATLLWESEDDQDFSWSSTLGFLYKPVSQWNFKLNFSKSFRCPTLEERFEYINNENIIELGDPDLDSETSLATDFGIKYIQDNLTAGLNIFHNKMKNLVIQKAAVIDEADYLINTNAGEALLYGFELFGTGDLPYNFSLSSNLSYVYAEDVKENAPLALIPPLNGQLILNYRYKNLLNFSAEMNAFARQDRIADWELETPGYAYFNFLVYTNNFEFFHTKHQIFFRIDNFTDKAYRNHLSTNRGAMLMEPGRNFGLSWKVGL